MRLIVLLTLACASALTACGDSDGALSGSAPNVLVLVMDTTRADRWSTFGYDRPTTPFLDSLAATSTVFSNCWSSSPWTGPSHATIFTGLRPEHHGFLSGVRFYLSDVQTTLAEILSRHGYRSLCLTNNDYVTETFGLVQGFEATVNEWEKKDRRYPWAAGTHEHAIEWVRDMRRRGERWFLFINDMEPHAPYTPPPEFQKRFLVEDAPPDRLASLRAFEGRMAWEYMLGLRPLSAGDWSILSDLYDAEIATLDAEIRKLFEGLGNLDDTIVIVVGDHGENLGEHGLADHFFSLHRNVLHVPLVIRAPSGLPRGAVVEDLVRTEDLLPTILELTGIPPPEEIDGRSLTSDLPGRTARALFGRLQEREIAKEIPEFLGSPLDRSLRSVYDGRHHLIVGSDGRKELYDVTGDPAESTNLAPDAGDLLRRLEEGLPEFP